MEAQRIADNSDSPEVIMSINSKIRGPIVSLKQNVQHVARHSAASPFMESLMRLGYLARGLVYGIIGLLALQVVLGRGGALTDMQGAIVALGKSPVGGAMMYVVLVGLVGYGLWGLVRAIADPLHEGTDATGIAERIGNGLSGISYLLLALLTYGLITGGASAAQSGAQTAQLQQLAGTILSKPWGQWVIALLAVVVIGVGISQIYKGFHPNFGAQFKPYALSSQQRKWIERMGRFGSAARGLVFSLIGFSLGLAAVNDDPSRAKGIEGVLASILDQPFGPVLLGIVAVGLIAFGIYSGLSGFWLRFSHQANA